tara:strand:+ start:949 stop:1560 length:612 start_codon:yes stop_codon:yes gene_type:complete
MTVETGTYISDFNVALPADTDPANELDDHLRLIKTFVLATFAGSTGDEFDEAINATSTQIDSWDSRLTTLEGLTFSQITPKLGVTDTTGYASNDTISVTGLGFQPKTIWAWSTAKTTNSRGGISFSAWNEDHTSGYVASLSTDLGTFANSANFVSFATFMYASSGQSLSSLSIGAVNSDGFDITINLQASGGEEPVMMWVAFP